MKRGRIASIAAWRMTGLAAAPALGASLNQTMKCWGAILPHTVRHPLLRGDLMAILAAHQRQYPGAMYSGCGGGYLIVVSEAPVPGAFQITVRPGRRPGIPERKS